MKLRFGYVSRNQTMRSTEMIFRARIGALFLAALASGCASPGSRPSEEPVAAASPLSSMIGRQVLVLPAQLISTAAPGGAWEVRPGEEQLLRLLDQEITDAFRKRGIRGNWTFAEDIIASATRNGGLAGNPLGLPVAGIRRVKAGDTPLPEPLASNIRTLVSLTSARYVVMPIEVNVDTTGGQRKGTMRVFLIDARTARVLWTSDVAGQPSRDPAVVSEAMSPFGFRIIARELAGVFADMVVAQ